jgi:predicted metal-dependent HD superfamily phosphohydrolase
MISLSVDWSLLIDDLVSFRFATFYHDIIYDPQRQDNEIQSAIFAETALTRLRVPSSMINKIRDFIISTEHHELPTDCVHNGLPYFLDADLAVLGCPLPNYFVYAKQIRQEYSVWSDAEYASGRMKVLRAFLERPNLYYTDAGLSRFNSQAKLNIARELELLATGVSPFMFKDVCLQESCLEDLTVTETE